MSQIDLREFRARIKPNYFFFEEIIYLIFKIADLLKFLQIKIDLISETKFLLIYQLLHCKFWRILKIV